MKEMSKDSPDKFKFTIDAGDEEDDDLEEADNPEEASPQKHLLVAQEQFVDSDDEEDAKAPE